MAQIQVEKERDNQQLQNGKEQPMHYGINATADHMDKARNRCHKGIFYGPLPALHVDDIGHPIEGHTQVGPDRGPNHQHQCQILHLLRGEGAACKPLCSHSNERDASFVQKRRKWLFLDVPYLTYIVPLYSSSSSSRSASSASKALSQLP